MNTTITRAKKSDQVTKLYTSKWYNPRYMTPAAFIVAGYFHITPRGNVVPSTRGGSNAMLRMLASRQAARYFGIPSNGRSRANNDLTHMMQERIHQFGLQSIMEMVAAMKSGDLENPIPVYFITNKLDD